MKIYVAARFTEKEEVSRIYKLLEDKGHSITADWTKHKPIKPYDKNQNIAEEYAVEDMDGIIECDCFILLTSEQTGSGSSGELGAAILSSIKFGKPRIYVVGKYTGNNFFYFHPSVVIKDTTQQVLAEL